jgi:hypothetical protein
MFMHMSSTVLRCFLCSKLSVTTSVRFDLDIHVSRRVLVCRFAHFGKKDVTLNLERREYLASFDG